MPDGAGYKYAYQPESEPAAPGWTAEGIAFYASPTKDLGIGASIPVSLYYKVDSSGYFFRFFASENAPEREGWRLRKEAFFWTFPRA